VTPAVRSRALLNCLAGACLIAALTLSTVHATAMTVERVVSPGGIEAWLVRNSAPMIVLEFAMQGSADQDPSDKPGVANLAASLLDEGAGPYDAMTFHARLERSAIEIGFRAGRDYLRGNLRSLRENQNEAFEYLRLALTQPRFDAEAVERMRAQLMSRLRRETVSPTDLANRNWWATAFPGHPYGRPVEGTLESLPRITVEDLRSYAARVLARDTLKVAIVGDVDAQAAGMLLDRTFGSLPARAGLDPVTRVSAQGLGHRIVIKLDVPQAAVSFGSPGVSRSDPDFMAAYIVNHILGGGSFSSRLYREVREKRGLAYGISDSLVWLNQTAVMIGHTATRADATGKTIEIIEQETHRLAEEGPTEQELIKAKSYLKGSFVLGLDSSNAIANLLVQMQLDNLGIDYIDRRAGLIDAVTLADAKRVAKRLLDHGLLITVAGRPEGLAPKEGE
jgi:zinc protease